MNDEPAVLDTESIHVTIEVAPKTKDELESNQNGKEKQSKSKNKSSLTSTNPQEGSVGEMRNVELSSERIQQGFGDFN